jgi:cell division protein FtsQ
MNDKSLPSNRRLARPQAEPKAVERRPSRKRPSLRVSFAGVKQRFASVFTVTRTLVGVLAFLGAVTASTWGMHRYVSTSARFALRSLNVKGAAHRLPEQVTKQAGLKVGMNLFTIDLERTRQTIQKDPWVESAKIERKLPDRIDIEIVEREAKALVVMGEDLYLADGKGQVFKRYEQGDPMNFPVISGVASHNAIVGDRAGVTVMVKRSLLVISEFERLPLKKKFPMQELHVTSEGAIQLVVGKEGVLLSLGKPPYREKLERATKVLHEIERRQGKVAVIYLDNEAHPERIVARLR